jgi:hypothetical protein
MQAIASGETGLNGLAQSQTPIQIRPANRCLLLRQENRVQPWHKGFNFWFADNPILTH